MASADFSQPVSSCCQDDSPARPGRRETSQVKSRRFPSAFAGSTGVSVGMTLWHPRPLPGYPALPAWYPVSVRRIRDQGHRLPSDSASRRTPLPSLAVPVITARRGLSPPTSLTCLAHKPKRQRQSHCRTPKWAKVALRSLACGLNTRLACPEHELVAAVSQPPARSGCRSPRRPSPDNRHGKDLAHRL